MGVVILLGMKDSTARLNQLKVWAFTWYMNEYGTDAMDKQSNGDIYAIAVPRVKAVFSGEVRWSEASPGDKAIWNQRPHNTKQWLEGVDFPDMPAGFAAPVGTLAYAMNVTMTSMPGTVRIDNPNCAIPNCGYCKARDLALASWFPPDSP